MPCIKLLKLNKLKYNQSFYEELHETVNKGKQKRNYLMASKFNERKGLEWKDSLTNGNETL